MRTYKVTDEIIRGSNVHFNRLFVTRKEVNQHQLVRKYLLSAVQEAAVDQYIDPISLRIIKAVSPHCTFPCTLLSLFSLRYSELFNLSFNDLSTKKRLYILQSKTKKSKYFDNTYLQKHLKLMPFDFDSPLVIVTYEHLKEQIKKAKRLSGFRLSRVCMESTHIFRHLTASWLKYLGSSEQAIAKRLGHDDLASNASYIHNWNEISIY